jgi:hypothetical protein
MIDYCTIKDIRDEAIVEAKVSDERLREMISMASRFIEKATRRVFGINQDILFLDGNDKKSIMLDIPIIQVDSISIDDKEQDLNYFVIYNRFVPDDRKFPQIKVKSGYAKTFTKGEQNIKIIGTFGYVEPDKSIPILIKRACIKLIINDCDLLGDEFAQAKKRKNQIVSETTDSNSYRLSELAISGSVLSGIADVDRTIAMYRKSMSITSV